MTEQQIATVGAVPGWRLADRMRRALDHAGIGVSEMADELGYNRDSIGRWINGRAEPRSSVLMAWALRTGVDYEWLRTGVVRHQGLEPRTRWLTASDLELVA